MHLHFTDIDRLVAECVAPLVRELDDQAVIRSFFFVRHWQGGRHLRLRLRRVDGSAPALIETVGDRIRDYMARYPSSPGMPLRAYEELARRLMAVEPGNQHVEPLQDVNTVRPVPYAGDPVLEENYWASSRLAIDLLCDPALSPERRTRVALVFTALTAVRGSQLTGTPIAEHAAEAYDRWGGALLGDARAEYERVFGQRWPRQREMVGRLIATLTEARGDELGPEAASWDDAIRALARVIPGPRTAFLLHHAAHMHNNRIGLGLADEAYLRHLIRAGCQERGAPK